MLGENENKIYHVYKAMVLLQIIMSKDTMETKIFTAVTGVGSSPALATCEISQVLHAGVSCGFPRVVPFRPTYRLARLDMSEIFLKGTLN